MGTGKEISGTIDWLRFAMAACVVLLHTGSLGADSPLLVYSSLCILFPQGICRLAVPIFFFISGYLFFSGLENWDASVWYQKAKRRFRSLVVPYFLWNLIAAVCIFSYSALRARTGAIDPVSFQTFWTEWGGLRLFWDCDKGMPLDYPLWFIRNLIVFIALTPLIFICIKKFHCSLIILIAILYFSGVSSALEGLLFFTSGAFFRIKGIDVLKSFSAVRIPALVLSLLLLICLIPSYNGAPEIYRICKGLFVITGTITTFNLVSSGISGGQLKTNALLTSASFFIFATHGILILHDFARFIVMHILPGEGEWWYCAELFLRPGIAIGICLMLFILLDKICPSILKVLNGGRRLAIR